MITAKSAIVNMIWILLHLGHPFRICYLKERIYRLLTENIREIAKEVPR